MKHSFKRITAIIVLILFCVLMVLPFLGCSSRKKTLEENKEEIKIDNSSNSENSSNSNSNIKVNNVTVVDDKNQTVTVKKTYSPVDATKPASVTDPSGKKHDLNNADYTEETTTQKNDTKIRNSSNSENSSNSSAKSKASGKAKITCKKENSNLDLDSSGMSFGSWFWIGLFIIIVLLIIYLNHRFKLVERVTSLFV